MDSMIPRGAVALDDSELALVSGGGIWGGILVAFGIGYKAGQWIWCAVECLVTDS